MAKLTNNQADLLTTLNRSWEARSDNQGGWRGGSGMFSVTLNSLVKRGLVEQLFVGGMIDSNYYRITKKGLAALEERG